jgi:hypothetical protein
VLQHALWDQIFLCNETNILNWMSRRTITSG